jgi:hypothetical protein
MILNDAVPLGRNSSCLVPRSASCLMDGPRIVLDNRDLPTGFQRTGLTPLHRFPEFLTAR